MIRLVFAIVAFVALATNSFASENSRKEPAPIFPGALKPGDTIEIVAAAKYLDKERVTLAKKRLEEMGFKVRIPENLFRRKGFWAAPTKNAPPN